MHLTHHKTVALHYFVTALGFLFVGFLLMLLLRWQLAWPTAPMPGFVAALVGSANAPSGYMAPEFYNQLVAMHGTIMIFLAIVPVLTGAFGNYLVPLLIGARDMAFPRLNAASYWTYLVAGAVTLASFSVEGGAADSGWTAYPPMAILATRGQELLARGHCPAGRVGDAERDQRDCHGGPVASARGAVHAPLLLRLGPARRRALIAAGVSVASGGRTAAIDGSSRRHELLSAKRPGGERSSAPGRLRRWQRAALAASVLVSRPSRGVCAHPPGDRHRVGSHPPSHGTTVVGLSRDGLVRALPWRHVDDRVGTPHVPDRHGDNARRVFSDHHDDRLDSIRGAHHGTDALALGRLDPLHDGHALRARVPADVWHRRADRLAARTRGQRRHPARHLVRRRPFSFSGRARHDLRDLRGHLLLVSQSDRPHVEPWARRRALLGIAGDDDGDLPADVHAGPARRQSPPLRCRPIVRPCAGDAGDSGAHDVGGRGARRLPIAIPDEHRPHSAAPTTTDYTD